MSEGAIGWKSGVIDLSEEFRWAGIILLNAIMQSLVGLKIKWNGTIYQALTLDTLDLISSFFKMVNSILHKISN